MLARDYNMIPFYIVMFVINNMMIVSDGCVPPTGSPDKDELAR
jgi:hypothetical protein